MEQKIKRGFASDNNSGVHPEILNAMSSVNRGHTIAYGDDVYTESAIQKFKKIFGKDIDVYFVFTGTGANVLGLKATTEPFNAVICADTAHIHVDECGAPEKFTGCKLLTIPTKNGKITTQQIKPYLHSLGFEHHAQPRVISITQATELGTVYDLEEIKEITDFAHNNNLLVHMDGARLCNAAAGLHTDLKIITSEAGIDVLSFGGTKNGMMYGEAIVFFNKEFSESFKYIRKQGMQLASKMRFIAIQFETLLSNNLWLKNARHANNMAQLLAGEVSKIPQVKITQKVEANGVFAVLPGRVISVLQKEYFFYVWNEETSEVRWMTSFDTTKQDIMNFVKLLKKVLK